MNKMNWRKWAAIFSCCTMVGIRPPITALAAEIEIQEDMDLLDSAGNTVMKTWENVSDFTEWFCTVIRMEMQLTATPLIEPYLLYIVSGASRSNPEIEAELLPQPAPGSTLLSEHKTKFVWNNKGCKTFTIREASSGEVICQKDVAKQKEVVIVPKEVGMKTGHTYYWELDGDGRVIRRELCLIDATIESEVLKILPELNKVEMYEDVDRHLLQAAYLISLSDKSNGRVDLHWLAVEMMLPLKTDSLSTERSVNLRKILIDSCIGHLNERLQQSLR